MEALGEREQIALGQLVEPVPWWTVSAVQRRQLRASASRSLRLVRAAARAIETLRASAPMGAVDVDTPRRPGLFDSTAIAESTAPCKPREQVDPAFVDDGDVVPCGPSQALALGGVGVSLLRPMLVEWPTSQVPPSARDGGTRVPWRPAPRARRRRAGIASGPSG